MKGRALWDILLVEVDENKEKVSSGGLILAPVSKEDRFLEGVVAMCGEGRISDKGILIPMVMKVGDIVYFPAFLNKKIKLEDKEYYVINQENVVYIKGEQHE